MTRILLISNVGPDDPGGRAEGLGSRAETFDEHGISTAWGIVRPPYLLSFLPSIVRLALRGRREDVDLIVSVSNPFHLQLVGYLVSRLLGVPWIVEFRDPMVTNPDREPGSLMYRIVSAVERFCVTRSSRVIWSDGAQFEDGYFIDTYDVAPSRVVTLPFRGFEPENFEGVEPVDYDDFTITYAGSFYEGWIEPYAFIEGLSRYVEDPTSRSADGGQAALRVQFYGDWTEEYQGAVEDAGIADIVETNDFVPHEEIVPVLKGSDVALYVGGNDPANRLNVPSKIWDYVGARVPILAVVDPSFRVAGLIREHDLGLVADPADPESIRDAIERLHSGEYDFEPPATVYEQFTRDRKDERYLTVVQELTGETDH